MLRIAIVVAALAVLGVFTGVSTASSGPMADAGLDQTVSVETVVHLDGTGSSHPTETLSDYEWRIQTPDGREIEPDCPSCERSQFTPTTVGRYEVTLTVTGPNGTQSSDTLYVYVQDAGPNVRLSGEQTPDPGDPVTYTASTESADAELEEIAWAVEDEIVAVRSLDGTTDESELSLAFRDAETHRVQVVVRDTNGRTAYDQLYVQPHGGETAISSPDPDPSPEPGGCLDPDYRQENLEECLQVETPNGEPDTAEEPDDVSPFEVLYETEGYENRLFEGLRGYDSNYIGQTVEEVGLDSGENAHWRQGGLERSYESLVEAGSRFFFGQDEETVTCEIEGGSIGPSRCAQKVAELEETGETSNVYSPSKGGGYSEYGLTGGKRVRGENPTDLEDEQKAEVTIVIQQEEDGIVDEAVDKAEPATNRVQESVNSILDEDNEEPSSPSNRNSDISTNPSHSIEDSNDGVDETVLSINSISQDPVSDNGDGSESEIHEPDISISDRDLAGVSSSSGVNLTR